MVLYYAYHFVVGVECCFPRMAGTRRTVAADGRSPIHLFLFSASLVVVFEVNAKCNSAPAVQQVLITSKI
jgi:hypothetical protein